MSGPRYSPGTVVLTYDEQLILSLLLDGPLDDRDRISERVLINSGFARRIDPGRMEITSAGVDKLGELAKARGEPDDIFNGDHGFGGC